MPENVTMGVPGEKGPLGILVTSRQHNSRGAQQTPWCTFYIHCQVWEQAGVGVIGWSVWSTLLPTAVCYNSLCEAESNTPGERAKAASSRHRVTRSVKWSAGSFIYRGRVGEDPRRQNLQETLPFRYIGICVHLETTTLDKQRCLKENPKSKQATVWVTRGITRLGADTRYERGSLNREEQKKKSFCQSLGLKTLWEHTVRREKAWNRIAALLPQTKHIGVT